MTSTFALVALALGPLAQSTGNDPITILIQEGDPVPGVGNLSLPYGGAVNDSGSWALYASTSPPFARVVLVDGALVLQEGQALAGGTFQQASPVIQIDADGRSLVAATSAGGVYLDTTPLVLAGDPAGAVGFGPGSTYTLVVNVSVEGAGRALLHALVDDPGVGLRTVLVTITYDQAGNVLSEELRAEVGQTLPGLPAAILSFDGWPGGAVSDAGSALYVADLVNGPACDDRAVVLDQTPLAVQGQPSPWGSPWSCSGLSATTVAISSAGHVAYDGQVATASGNKRGVVLDGAPFVLEGDVLGALFPSPVGLVSASLGEVAVDQGGDLVWAGTWNGIGNQGFFLGKNLLVQEGVTTVASSTIEQSFVWDMSPNGDWILFMGVLDSGLRAVCLYDARQAPNTYCVAGSSSAGCRASIAAAGQASSSAVSGFDLRVGAVKNGQPGLFFFGTSGRQASPWGNGDSFQCVTPPVQRLPAQAASGGIGCQAGFVTDLNQHWNVTKPQLNPGVGAVVQAQAWYRDPDNTSNQTTALSDAVEFVVLP